MAAFTAQFRAILIRPASKHLVSTLPGDATLRQAKAWKGKHRGTGRFLTRQDVSVTTSLSVDQQKIFRAASVVVFAERGRAYPEWLHAGGSARLAHGRAPDSGRPLPRSHR